MEIMIAGIKAYLGIALLLLLPGLLVRLCLRAQDTNALEAEHAFLLPGLLVESFLISLLINGVVAAVFSLLDLGLQKSVYALLVIDVGLLGCWLTNRSRSQSFWLLTSSRLRNAPLDWLLVLVIGLFFVLMLFQGGVLDMLADGWWHMAYVAQMLSENSLFIERHPLVGTDSAPVIYPPLWHLQLALIAELTGLEIPILWHFLAAFGGTLLLCALYRMTYVLTGNRVIALIAVVAHIFLIGGLSSYARVGSWPGNISYIALYYSFTLTFLLSNQVSNTKTIKIKAAINNRDLVTTMILLTCSILAMTGLHGVGVALYLLGIFAYFVSLGILGSRINPVAIGLVDRRVCGTILVVGAVLGAFLALTVFKSRYLFLMSSPPAYDPYLSLLIPTILLAYLAGYRVITTALSGCIGKMWARSGYFLILVLAMIFCIDFAHVKELFIPNPDPIGRHVPRDFQGVFGNWLFLPFWEHQLRGGMLISGVLTLALGLILPIFWRDRASVFLFGLCGLVFLVLFSPYFFTLAAFVIPLASTYRISLLLFSPVIFAIVFYRLAWR